MTRLAINFVLDLICGIIISVLIGSWWYLAGMMVGFVLIEIVCYLWGQLRS